MAPSQIEAGVRTTVLRIAGGFVRSFPLATGDRVSIIDLEGGQAATFEALDADGANALPHLATAMSCPDAIGPIGEMSLLLSGPETVPGAVLEFVAPQPLRCTLSLARPASAPDMLVPTTDFEVRVTPNPADQTDAAVEAPPPLVPPRVDVRVAQGTAWCYRVAAGEYIQVVDIDGRQCSDFLAFDAGLLDQGIECGLDATVTRTLTGRSHPGPGLASKFFDARMRPMLEVVQDTCGRHDTFALACTAKYYDDMGYPGHANCSDNFSRVLSPHGIAARPAWPAINFFYNLSVADGGTLGLDEPWSRPGDYVLLRALTDLLCASSACPDDIDPANGWNPTDIQVRVYPAEHSFPRATASRITPDSPPVMTLETAFHPRIAPLSRRMVEYRGYWLPQSFAGEGTLAEYWACREKVAMIDLSPLRKFEVLGPDAEALLDHAVTRDITRLAIGQVVYTAIVYPHGGMLDDATIFRLGQNNFRFVCGDPYCGIWLRDLAAKRGLRAWVRTSTDQLHNLGVQGPRSRELLRNLIVTPAQQPGIADLKWFRFTIGRFGSASGPAIVISRTGYTGELGYEIWCHPKDAVTLWDGLADAGRPLGLSPLGLEALDMLRIEAGLVFANHEFCDQTDPFEAGIGFTVPLATKQGDFIGKDALARRRAQPQRRLAGLEIEGREVASHGDPVFAGRAQIGVVTSGTRSPILDKTIALARLDIGYIDIGTRLEIGKLDGHQKRLAAQVVRFPHYDPDKTRVRA